MAVTKSRPKSKLKPVKKSTSTKPVAKKKVKVEKPSLPVRENERTSGDSNVPTREITAVMEDTFERVYEEIFPNMQTRDYRDRLELALGEEAYIIRLFMLLGHHDDKPRHGVKFRKHEYKSIPDCGRHDD